MKSDPMMLGVGKFCRSVKSLRFQVVNHFTKTLFVGLNNYLNMYIYIHIHIHICICASNYVKEYDDMMDLPSTSRGISKSP